MFSLEHKLQGFIQGLFKLVVLLAKKICLHVQSGCGTHPYLYLTCRGQCFFNPANYKLTTFKCKVGPYQGRFYSLQLETHST